MSNISEENIKKDRKPLQGRELIMASMPFTKEDPKKSWMYFLSTLVCLIIAGSLTFLNVHPGIKVLFSILFALMMVRTFIIYHDYQHGAIFTKSKLAKPLMLFYGMFILTPQNIWKRTHDFHHHNNSKLSNLGIGSYPLLSRKEYQALDKKGKFMYLLARNPITIMVGYLTLFVINLNIYSVVKSPKNHWDSGLALIMHVGLGVLVYHFFGWEGFVFSFLIPFTIAFAMGAYLFFAQHNFPSATFKDNDSWEYSGAALESTSMMEMNPIMHWFTGNIGYHHVHHVNHRIPFYRLKEAMDSIPELQNPKKTSLNPIDVYRCLRLKVWDPEKGKMTGL